MTGGAFAASTALKKNSVTSAAIKKNAVTSPKVKDRSLLAADFKSGQLPSGPQGPQGPAGSAKAYGFINPQAATSGITPSGIKWQVVNTGQTCIVFPGAIGVIASATNGSPTTTVWNETVAQLTVAGVKPSSGCSIGGEGGTVVQTAVLNLSGAYVAFGAFPFNVAVF